MIEQLRQNNIYVTYMNLSMELWGMVYYNNFCEYHIAINNRLAANQQEKVLRHELRHIERDLPRYNYIIGINMQYTKLEEG